MRLQIVVVVLFSVSKKSSPSSSSSCCPNVVPISNYWWVVRKRSVQFLDRGCTFALPPWHSYVHSEQPWGVRIYVTMNNTSGKTIKVFRGIFWDFLIPSGHWRVSVKRCLILLSAENSSESRIGWHKDYESSPCSGYRKGSAWSMVTILKHITLV